MTPVLTIEFSCLEEMVVITHHLREIYREILDAPEAQGNSDGAKEFRKNCLSKVQQMDFYHLQAKGHMRCTTPDFSYGSC